MVTFKLSPTYLLPMVIDRALLNVYTCCKCGNQWANWPNDSIPLNCPKCRNIRWNQHYTKDEYPFIRLLEKEHTIKNEETKEDYLGIKINNCYLDFIVYDFLHGIRPQPDIFEIKQVLTIPKNKVEERHELILTIIRDRITNAENYKKERYSKYGIGYYGEMDSKHHLTYGDYTSRVRAIIKGCKHKDTLEIRAALYTSPYPHNKGQITQKEVKREIEIKEEEIKVKVKSKKSRLG